MDRADGGGVLMSDRPLRLLYDRRELLAAWTGRLIRARYRQSILGVLWAILQPLGQVAILTIVFTQLVVIDTGAVPYVLFCYAGIVPWTLSSGATTEMATSLVDNMGLVTKIYFPREILPLAVLAARLLDFLIGFVVLALLIGAMGHQGPGLHWLWLLPLLATQLAAITGIGLAGAAIQVYFRDVKHLVVLALQLWFYASPVIYPVSLVPRAVQPLYFLNPMAGVIEGYRSVLLHGRPPDRLLIVSVLVALFLAFAGVRVFRRLEGEFADVI
jgi:lipopolysaccharide transport system permease protein